MLDANACMNDLAPRLRDAFGARLVYLGLQGSYARGEADERSDLDVMCVLELRRGDAPHEQDFSLLLDWCRQALERAKNA